MLSALPALQVGCTYTPVPAKPVSTTISIKPEEVAAAMKDALAAAGLTEEEAKQEQQQHQKLNQQSRMRQGLFGEGGIHLPKLPSPFHKHGGSGSNAAAAEIAAAAPAAAATPAAAAASTAAANTPVAVASTQAAAPAQAPAGPVTSDPLSVTHKAEFNVTAGGKLIGKVVVGLFGNTAPKTVQNVSVFADGRGVLSLPKVALGQRSSQHSCVCDASGDEPRRPLNNMTERTNLTRPTLCCCF